MFKWLVDARHLATNPFALMTKAKADIDPHPTRFLRLDAWEFLRSSVEWMPEKTRRQIETKIRAKHLIALFYFTAARLSDVVLARMGDFSKKIMELGGERS